MLKFTINTKDLKTMMEKAMTGIDKKSKLETMKRLYFQIDENNTLRILGTDLVHYVEVAEDVVFDTEAGVFGIDIEDIKVLTKMSGLIKIEDVSTDKTSKISVTCGKKILTIPKYGNVDIFLPNMDDTEEEIVSVKENWLLETVAKLNTFTKDESHSLLEAFHFNLALGRVEAVDGYRIGTRKLTNEMIITNDLTSTNAIMLHKMCVPVFKKIMDKKSEAKIIISQDQKYIKIQGKGFTYITKKLEGKYYDVKHFFDINTSYHFFADRKNMVENMKYNTDLAKMDKDVKRPVLLMRMNDKLYSCLTTSKYEAIDELTVTDNTMKDGYSIGFDPQFLTEIFETVDTEKPECIGDTSKSPLIIKGNEYQFLVLPVNFSSDLYDKYHMVITTMTYHTDFM